MDDIKRNLKESLDNFNSSVYSWAKSADDYAVWLSWSFGAYYILNAALPLYLDEQKPRNFLKTQSLYELALQPIITSYFFQLDQQSGSKKTGEKEMGPILKRIQDFIFGIEIGEQITLYKKFYIQYMDSLEKQHNGDREHNLLLYCQFLEYRWLECCTDRQLVKWNSIDFPCKEYSEFAKARHHKNDALVQKALNSYNTMALYRIINRAFMFSDILLNISRQPLKDAQRSAWYNTVLGNLSAADEELSKIPD